jgi:hypothetical protein
MEPIRPCTRAECRCNVVLLYGFENILVTCLDLHVSLTIAMSAATCMVICNASMMLRYVWDPSPASSDEHRDLKHTSATCSA